MTIEESPSGLKRLVTRGFTFDRVLLLGPPGIGKTTVVKEYAKLRAEKENLEFVEVNRASRLKEIAENPEGKFLFLHLYAPVLRVEDLSFLAPDASGEYDWRLPLVLRAFTASEVRGLIFLDEITNVQLPDVQSMLFSLVLDKTISHHSLSEGVEVVAAGNRPEESAVAQELPEPLVDRFRYIISVRPPTAKEWVEWMSEQNKPFEEFVAAWVLSTGETYVPATKGLEKSITPRTLSQFAWDLANMGGVEAFTKAELRKLAVWALGREKGAEFAEFATTRVNVEEILQNPRKIRELPVNAKYVAFALLSKLTVDEKTLCRAARVVEEEKEFSMVYLRMVAARLGKQTLTRIAAQAARRCSSVKEIIASVVRSLREYNIG